MIVKEIIEFGEKEFNKHDLCFYHGTDNPWDEAVALVTYVLQISPNAPNTILNNKLTLDQIDKIKDLYKKRIELRIPAPYLTKRAYFAGYEFYVDDRVMIPRSPFAELIELRFQPWIGNNYPYNVLDLCTGSGCIATSISLEYPQAKIDAVDISIDALEVAKINVDMHKAQEHVNIYQSDVYESVNNSYNLIVSNPPYVSFDEYNLLPDEFRHEPKLSLTAKAHGLDIVDRILRESAKYLQKDGVLIVEVGNSATTIEKKYKNVSFTWIDFEKGGDGVFIFYKDQLIEYF